MRVCPECERRTESEFCSGDGSRTIDEAVLCDREDPFLGRVLADRYRILGLLGRGGMGRVYVADQFAMKRRVAIKAIRAGDEDDARERMAIIQRFQREAQATSRLSHPNTVRVFDFGHTDDGVMYLAMELLRGRTLGRLLATEGTLAPERAMRICAQVAMSLAEAHDHDIVHRDLKPDNIMLTEVVGTRDFVKVLDFGIARILSPGTDGAQSITRKGALMGTPTYMSPEQATGYSATFSSDLYALGVILFECLAGHPPYTAETPLAVLMKHAHAAVPPLGNVDNAAAIPAGLKELVAHLLAKQPMARPRSAVELATLLESLLEGRAPRPRSEPTPAAGRRRYIETAQQFRNENERKAALAADFDERPTRVFEPVPEPVHIRPSTPRAITDPAMPAVTDDPPSMRPRPGMHAGPSRMSAERSSRPVSLPGAERMPIERGPRALPKNADGFVDDVDLVVAEQKRRLRRRVLVIAMIGLFLVGLLAVTAVRRGAKMEGLPRDAKPAATERLPGPAQ